MSLVAADFTETAGDHRSSSCSRLEVATGRCDAGGGPEIVIGDEREGGGPPVAPAPGPNPGAIPAPPAVPGPLLPGVPGVPGEQEDDGPTDVCATPELWRPPCLPLDPAEPAPVPAPVEEAAPPPIPPVITETDVAVFAPVPVVPVIEPHGVAVRGAPMNVAVPVHAHSVTGSLFGAPVTLTFTPESIWLDYGDGTTGFAGATAPTWDELGQEQLTATSTSHAYREARTFEVSVTVAYSAIADFGPWGVFPIAGEVVSSPAAVDVRVYEVEALLVERTCVEDPAGPGC
ncbi:hypothetical protein [Microbacterium amylolyticum]|uniref:PKD domain-containing protein n=1 Tax=Microbacterium amylolyticum TaxID=936337 RepID=A0ABS4ZEX3_9MICO|nr:hypothetical protein [Microbacterium amylolyticum]MBP2435832.1 hypothetical protein [Microbacterium amylolyticum]